MPVGPLCYTVHADSYLRIEKAQKACDGQAMAKLRL